MAQSRSIIINIFSVSSNVDIEEIFTAIEKTIYSEDVGFGFKDIKNEDNEISGVLIKRSATFIFDYNSVSTQFEKRPIFIYTEIVFSIDLNLNLIYVFGPISHLNQLKSVIRNTLTVDYKIETLDLTVYAAYYKLKDKNIKIQVQQFCIDKFNYENGLIGKFSGKVLHQKTVEKLIEQYQNDVIKLSISIFINLNNEFIVHISSNGSIKIECEDDYFDYYLNYLKNLLFQ